MRSASRLFVNLANALCDPRLQVTERISAVRCALCSVIWSPVIAILLLCYNRSHGSSTDRFVTLLAEQSLVQQGMGHLGYANRLCTDAALCELCCDLGAPNATHVHLV